MGFGGPIHSRLDDDPAYAEAIEAFVLVLAERIDELQEHDRQGDLLRLAVSATSLGRDADGVGFPLLRQTSEEVAAAARQGNSELAYKALVELTDVVRRVRQGHRGSL